MTPETRAGGAGIAGLGYALPAVSLGLRDLDARGLLHSDAVLLEGFGFDRVFTAETETPYELACRAGEEALARAGVAPAAVDLLIYAGPQGPTAFTTAPSPAESAASLRTTARFRFPGTRLQHRLGLDTAMVIGVDQGACTNLFAAVRVASAFCTAGQATTVLCVSAEFFPADAGREAIFNCTSDAGVAVVVRRGAPHGRIAGSAHVTKGYYWDADARHDEMVAAYFPTAAHVIREAAGDAGWQLADIDWVIPHNVSRRSWDVLMSLLRLPPDRLWDRNIARTGHTLAGDNFINLADAVASGDVRQGQKLILFSYGYGAHWTALAVHA